MSAPSPRKRHRKQRQRHGIKLAPRPAQPPAGPQQRGKMGVMIAVPTGDGSINFTIANLWAHCVRASLDPACPLAFDLHMEAGTRGIEYARNRIVDIFMDNTQDEWLLMIDADQIPPSNFADLFLVGDADIVSGLTHTWMGNGPPHTMLRVNNYGLTPNAECFNLPVINGAQALGMPYLVPIVGTGCIAIRRRVFEKLGRNRFYFTRTESGKIRGGEDINFSVDAQRAGFKIAVHPGVRFGHVKPINISQIEDFYEARHSFENQGGELQPLDTLSVSA